MRRSPAAHQYDRLQRALKHLLDARGRLNDARWLSQAQRLTPLIEEVRTEVEKLFAALEEPTDEIKAKP